MEIHSLLTDNIGNLLATKIFADCVLVTSDRKEFRAHKCVLACRSPVFAAMFKDGMVEAKTGRVQIADIQADTLDQMLRFIYTGAAPNLEGKARELSKVADIYQPIPIFDWRARELFKAADKYQSAPNLEWMARELFKAADKYQLMELKRHCEHSLAVSLNSKNACELLILADLHSGTHLKSQALDFIKSHRNEVMGSAGWKTLRIDLLNQILQSF